MPVFEIVLVGPGHDPVPELLHNVELEQVPQAGEHLQVGKRTLTVHRVQEFEPHAIEEIDGLILATGA